jgi:hypothetical protein
MSCSALWKDRHGFYNIIELEWNNIGQHEMQVQNIRSRTVEGTGKEKEQCLKK